MSLTEEQVQLIQDTWAIVYKEKVQNGVDLFITLFTHYPQYKNHFKQLRPMSIEELKTSAKMKAHATTVMHALQSWVENLVDLDVFVELVRKNAIRHDGRGLSKHEFHNLYELMPTFLDQKLGDKWTKPVQEAWTIAVTVMSDTTDAAIDEDKECKY